jgi:hypothetical protein
MFYIPAFGVDDWKKLLANPEAHWREGYSAHAIATRWQGAGGLPTEISEVLAAGGLLEVQMLIGLPEHKVALPGGVRASQTDLWVLARTDQDLISIAVEGKVRESFGPTLEEWSPESSLGKKERWSALCDLLGISPDCDRALRYQLVHRTASAVLEAKRFHAGKAVMVVHSFSAHRDGFAEFQAFARQLGASISAPGAVHAAGIKSGVELFFGVGGGAVCGLRCEVFVGLPINSREL